MQIWTSTEGVAGVVAEPGRCWSMEESTQDGDGEFVAVGVSLVNKFNIADLVYQMNIKHNTRHHQHIAMTHSLKNNRCKKVFLSFFIFNKNAF